MTVMLPNWRTCPRLSAGASVARAATASERVIPRPGHRDGRQRIQNIVLSDQRKRARSRHSADDDVEFGSSAPWDRYFRRERRPSACVPYMIDFAFEVAAELRNVLVVGIQNGGATGGRDSINSYLARAIPAIESKNSR